MTNTRRTPAQWEATPYGRHWSFDYELNGEKREDYDFRVEFGWGVGSHEQADVIRLLEAAPVMLTALLLAQRALNTAPRFRVGDTNSYDIAAIVDSAIATATINN
jgi:hypothetical protein